jgi:hypothetical protein
VPNHGYNQITSPKFGVKKAFKGALHVLAVPCSAVQYNPVECIQVVQCIQVVGVQVVSQQQQQQQQSVSPQQQLSVSSRSSYQSAAAAAISQQQQLLSVISS